MVFGFGSTVDPGNLARTTGDEYWMKHISKVRLDSYHDGLDKELYRKDVVTLLIDWNQYTDGDGRLADFEINRDSPTGSHHLDELTKRQWHRMDRCT